MGKTLRRSGYHDRFYLTTEPIEGESNVDLVHKRAYEAQMQREAAMWKRRRSENPS
jgi:hypothetical protein